MTTQNTTRRAVLAGAAAIPALSLPAAAAPECSYPDLAARLAAVRERWLARTMKDEADTAQFEQELAAVTGKPEGYRPDHTDPYFKEHLEIMERITCERPHDDPVDEDGASIAWNEIHDELFPITAAILQQPARSIADLGLQAQAFALNTPWYWSTTEPEDPDARRLVDSICKFAGVDSLPGYDAVPIDDDEAVQS
jgi:hypothetical protein